MSNQRGRMKTTVPYVIYCRISSWPQAKGHGIQRQLVACLEAIEQVAGSETVIVGVFTEIASGGGELPVRDSALRYARQQHARIMVESVCRWTRRADDPCPTIVELACPLSKGLESKLETVLGGYKISLQPATCDWPAAPCNCTD